MECNSDEINDLMASQSNAVTKGELLAIIKRKRALISNISLKKHLKGRKERKKTTKC